MWSVGRRTQKRRLQRESLGGGQRANVPLTDRCGGGESAPVRRIDGKKKKKKNDKKRVRIKQKKKRKKKIKPKQIDKKRGGGLNASFAAA